MTPERAATAAIAAAAARTYAPAGRTPMHFAAGKLRHDPIFTAVLARGLISDGARLVDLGCGQGVLFAWLLAARALHPRLAWPAGWPPPPAPASMFGIDLRPRAVRAARIALGDRARVEVGDVRDTPIPGSDVIAIFDVLHYIDATAQERVLDACVASLGPAGTLLLRVGDATAGWRFAVTRLGDYAITVLRGTVRPRFHFRSLGQWSELLRARGLAVEAAPMSAGTPFANTLLIGRKSALSPATSPEHP